MLPKAILEALRDAAKSDGDADAAKDVIAVQKEKLGSAKDLFYAAVDIIYSQLPEPDKFSEYAPLVNWFVARSRMPPPAALFLDAKLRGNAGAGGAKLALYYRLAFPKEFGALEYKDVYPCSSRTELGRQVIAFHRAKVNMVSSAVKRIAAAVNGVFKRHLASVDWREPVGAGGAQQEGLAGNGGGAAAAEGARVDSGKLKQRPASASGATLRPQLQWGGPEAGQGDGVGAGAGPRDGPGVEFVDGARGDGEDGVRSGGADENADLSSLVLHGPAPGELDTVSGRKRDRPLASGVELAEDVAVAARRLRSAFERMRKHRDRSSDKPGEEEQWATWAAGELTTKITRVFKHMPESLRKVVRQQRGAWLCVSSCVSARPCFRLACRFSARWVLVLTTAQS
jgi:hypothetical protein